MALWPLRVVSAFAIVLAVLVHASPLPGQLQSRQSLAQVVFSCTVPNTAALTFDDGPFFYLRNISNALASFGAKGTFFFNGLNWGCIYSAENVANIRWAYTQGHQIASHTWSHTNLANLSMARITDEMSRLDEALIRIVGVNPAFVRPPYGAYNDLVRQVAASRNQTIAIWDFDSGDGSRVPAAQSIYRYDDLVARHPSNVLTLNHEVYESTARDIVPHAISVLRARGYRLVTVAECLGMSPYQSVVRPQNGTWSC